MSNGEFSKVPSPEQQAIAMVVGEIPAGDWGTADRILLADHALAAKAIFLAGENAEAAGIQLYETLTALPTNDEAWQQAMLSPSDMFLGPWKNAVLAVFGGAGTHPELARGLCSRLEGSDILDLLPPTLTQVALLRAWIVEGSSPQAGAVVTEALAGNLTPEAFARILQQRHVAICSRETDGVQLAELVKHETMLGILLQNGQLLAEYSQALTASRQQNDKLVAEAQKTCYQRSLINQVHRALIEDFGDQAYSTLIAEDGVLAKIAKFDQDHATALEIQCNTAFLARNPKSSLYHAVLYNQNRHLDTLQIRINRNPGSVLQMRIRQSVWTELLRRANELSASDDAGYKKLANKASQLQAPHGTDVDIFSVQRAKQDDHHA